MESATQKLLVPVNQTDAPEQNAVPFALETEEITKQKRIGLEWRANYYVNHSPQRPADRAHGHRALRSNRGASYAMGFVRQAARLGSLHDTLHRGQVCPSN